MSFSVKKIELFVNNRCYNFLLALGFLKTSSSLAKNTGRCKATFISLVFNESGPHLVRNIGFDGALKYSRSSLVSNG